MRRRDFITFLGAAAAWPLAARAQPVEKVYRIGVLCPLACQGLTGLEPAFRLTLRDLGYLEGRNLLFEYRAAEGVLDRLPALAQELVQAKVDLIFTTFGTVPPIAAKRATASIPVVMGASGDPIRAGIISNLAKPGSNVTGVSSLTLESEGKRVELLKELLPAISTVGTFWHPENAYSALAIKEVERAAGALGLRVQPVVLRGPSDVDGAFETLKRERVDAVSVQSYMAVLRNRAAIIEFAERNRVVMVFPIRTYVEEGGLISYGANLADISRRAAHYVDRIFKGANPGDLPVEQATKLELVINLKTAKTLGLTIPPTLLARADEVIE
jgi:putative ABC transport system substrate-binding protein